MSERQPFPKRRETDDVAEMVQPAPSAVLPARRRAARGQREVWFLLIAVLLLSVVTLVTLSPGVVVSQGKKSATQRTTLGPALLARGTFRQYPLPQSDSEVMRPAIDHQGRIWFGAMGQNALVVFDPGTHTFQYLTPPQGRHGIMGVQVAPDDTIWFAEQSANYLGHYFPRTGRYQLYPLPRLTVLAPTHGGQVLSLLSAPNELALDTHGHVWFTEFSADRLGRLDPQTGLIQHYPLSATGSVQTLYPYGVIVDPQGKVWFTESGTNQLGRLDPTTGAIRLFAAPSPHALLMEIARDAQGAIWVTSFTPGLLFRLSPGTGIFTSYTAPFSGSESSALYGLLLAPEGSVWVTILAENVLARLDVAQQRFIYYRIPTPGTLPLGLAMDANQNLWFTGRDTIGMLHP